MSKKKAPPPEPSPPPRRKPLFGMAELECPPLLEGMRDQANELLLRVRDGEMLSLPISRPMPTIGRRVHELRLSDESGDWRVIYRTAPDHVLLVDFFKKTTQQSEKEALDRSRKRLRANDASVAAAIQAQRRITKKHPQNASRPDPKKKHR